MLAEPTNVKGGSCMRSRKSFSSIVAFAAIISSAAYGCLGADESAGRRSSSGGEDGAVPDDMKGPFECDGRGARELVSETHAARLTRRQIERTLVDVLSRFLEPSAAREIVTSSLQTASIPGEAPRYKRWDNDFSSAHAQALFAVADSVAKSVSSPSRYPAFVNTAVRLDPGACSSFDEATPSVDCRKQLIRNVGSRFLRHTLSDAEVDSYLQEYASVDAQEAFGNLIFRMILAPNSLFRLEANETPAGDAPDVLVLSSSSIANRLSYTFWNAPPDERLLELARTTDLASDESFIAALDHVLGKIDFEDSTQEFFGDWLRLEKVPHFESPDSSRGFATYAGDVAYDDALRDEMLDEVRELGTFVSTSGGNLRDLFTTEVSFARDENMMKVYGVEEPAPATVTPDNAVALPPGTHPGILTRAALLVSSSGAKNPVKRAIRIRQDVLCLPTPPPPADLPTDAFAAPPFDVDRTARDRYEQKTSVQPCGGCHAAINPPGYALSNYSGLGKFETTEPAFNEDGTYAGKDLPVDANVDLSALLGQGAKASNPSEFMSLLAERTETQKCFATAYAEYFLSRAIVDNDGCRVNRVYNALRGGKPLKDVMRSLALDPEFRIRRK